MMPTAVAKRRFRTHFLYSEIEMIIYWINKKNRKVKGLSMKAGAVEIAGPGSGSTVGLASGELSLSSRDHLFLCVWKEVKMEKKRRGCGLRPCTIKDCYCCR
jgi:hypothetical protein